MGRPTGRSSLRSRDEKIGLTPTGRPPSGAPEGATWQVVPTDGGTRCLLTLPASPKPVRVPALSSATSREGRLARSSPGGPDACQGPLDLAPYTKGGPSQWPQTVETKGTLGTGDGPYVVDTLTAPDENPYKSWMRFGGMDFFADGKSAALSTWSGDVWTVTGIDETLEKLTWKRFATGLFQPLGLKIVDEQGLRPGPRRDHPPGRPRRRRRGRLLRGLQPRHGRDDRLPRVRLRPPDRPRGELLLLQGRRR